MGSNETGLNLNMVQSAMSTAEEEANNVQWVIEDGFSGIIGSLRNNWGTKDGKTWVEGECQKAMNEVCKKAASNLSTISEVIGAVANAQFQDTGNEERARSPIATEATELAETINDKLDNGYVGIYEELASDLKTAETNFNTAFSEAVGALQSKVIAKTNEAFHKSGQEDKVSAECTVYINRVRNIVKTGLTHHQNVL